MMARQEATPGADTFRSLRRPLRQKNGQSLPPSRLVSMLIRLSGESAMKAALPALVLAALMFCPRSAPAADEDELWRLLHEAFGHNERICAVIERLDHELSLNPEDESLLNMRISAYGALRDPYSAKPDVETLAAMHPDSPALLLQKCMVEEMTGAEPEECRACYLRAAGLCERTGRTGSDADEYLLALLLAGSPKAEEAKRRKMDALSDAPADAFLKDMLMHFSRDMMVGKVERSSVHTPCPRKE